MSETLLEAVVKSLEMAHAHNANAGVAPLAVLWPDEGRQWASVIDMIQDRIPVVVLGDFEPDANTGPAYWIRCVIAETIEVTRPEGPLVVYLPGIARNQLRAVESCPPELAPIAELQYRSNWFSHPNGRAWTVRSFLANTERGLGLTVAEDDATNEVMLLALRQLLEMPLDRVSGQSLDVDFFTDLINPDPVRMLLSWIDDPTTVRRRLDAAQWTGFRQKCKSDYGFDPDADGELAAAHSLGERKGAWEHAWNRFAETPERYPGVADRLRQAKPMELSFEASESWPQDNEVQEDQLRKHLQDFAVLTPEAARTEAIELEGLHAWRRGTVWASLSKAPLAFSIEQLARLAELTSQPLGSDSLSELRDDYRERGWQADDAVIQALASVADGTGRDAVGAAVTAIYGPWAEAAASAMQELIGPASNSDTYKADGPRIGEDGVLTLFVDGLRLDIANRLAERLADARLEADVQVGLAALPTVTETAKPAIMPLFGDSLSAGPELYASSSESGTKASIQVTRALMEKEGIQVLSSNSLGDPSGRGWAEAGEIDHRGHDMGVRIVDYLDEEIDRIARRVRELLDGGWQRIEIVTDHGWVLLPGGLPKVELPVATTEKKKGRCARLKDGAAVDVPTFPWHWDRDTRIAIAPGLGCFEANKTFEHGGVSPQECIVPRITVAATSDVTSANGPAITKTKWLGLLCRIEIEGSEQGVTVDLRALAADPTTSIAEEAKETTRAGKISLVVPDEEHEGERVQLVLVSHDGTILAQRELVVGSNR